MFFKIYEELCLKVGLSPNAVAKKLSISSGAVSEWKKGRCPQNATLKKVADYFGVSTDYFLGIEKKEASAIKSEGDKNTIKIAGRDGSVVERTLTDAQLDLLKKMIEQLPDADNL